MEVQTTWTNSGMCTHADDHQNHIDDQSIHIDASQLLHHHLHHHHHFAHIAPSMHPIETQAQLHSHDQLDLLQIPFDTQGTHGIANSMEAKMGMEMGMGLRLRLRLRLVSDGMDVGVLSHILDKTNEIDKPIEQDQPIHLGTLHTSPTHQSSPRIQTLHLSSFLDQSQINRNTLAPSRLF